MNFKEIKDLLKLVTQLELTEFKMKDGEFELSIRTKEFSKVKGQKMPPSQQPVFQLPPAQAPGTTPPAAPAEGGEGSPANKTEETPSEAAAEEGGEDNLVAIKSPIVGTFYRSPAPDKSAYVKVGDSIEVGAVVCIVEAMKLFNEIESEVSGKIVKVLVEDASPVEYDQVLFLVDPS